MRWLAAAGVCEPGGAARERPLLVERADAASPVARGQSADAVSPVARERLGLLAAAGDAAMKQEELLPGSATSQGWRRCHEVGVSAGAAMELGRSFNGA